MGVYETTKKTINAKNQFIWEVFRINMNKVIISDHDLCLLPDWDKIRCAEIILDRGKGDDAHELPIRLKIGFSPDHVKEFLNHLDFNREYVHHQYSGEGLFQYEGCVWMKNGDFIRTETQYSNFGDYDVWVYHKVPDIPGYLL